MFLRRGRTDSVTAHVLADCEAARGRGEKGSAASPSLFLALPPSEPVASPSTHNVHSNNQPHHGSDLHMPACDRA
jgi:hypothetical protein